jgi:N-acetyltransferase
MKFEHFALNVEDASASVRVVHEPPRAADRARAARRALHDLPGRRHRPRDHRALQQFGRPIPDYKPPSILSDFHVAFVATTRAPRQHATPGAGATPAYEETLPDGSLLVMLRDPWGVPLQLVRRATPFPALRMAEQFRVDPTVVLEGRGVRLEPLRPGARAGARAAAADGELWKLHLHVRPGARKVPAPTSKPLSPTAKGRARARGRCASWRAAGSSGSTSYHDIVPAARRVEIGYTWYAGSWQRTHVNTACKLRLMEHAFDTLGCEVVGWRTDILNLRSQAAIERLGARKDGVIRRQQRRRDGTLRDTVMYSVIAEEWRESVRARLAGLLQGRSAPR